MPAIYIQRRWDKNALRARERGRGRKREMIKSERMRDKRE